MPATMRSACHRSCAAGTPGQGPLAGLAAGLRLAGGAGAAFAPCDMPFLTRAVYDRLTLTSGDGSGAYARSPKGEEPLVAVLRGDVHAALMAAVAQGTLPRTHKALDAAGVRSVAFDDAAPFSNINTPDDLAAAEARLAQP
ncbi:MAG: NTP transferase domain-containing protein [Alphaproteobacteria bacterium]